VVPKSVSLVVQLLLTLVGLVIVTTVVLTLGSYRSFHFQLERDASRLVRASADQTATTLTQFVELRSKQAQGFLERVTALCGETTPTGRTAWELGCVRSALGEYRTTEHVRGALFEYGRRVIARAGQRPRTDLPLPSSFARIVPRQEGFDYIIMASQGPSRLTVEYSFEDLAALFRGHAVLGAYGEIFLTDAEGHFVTAPRFGPSIPPGATRVEPIAECLQGATQLTAIDYRGVNTIHGLHPVPVFFGGACVDAHLAHDDAVAPAEALLRDLIMRGALFVLVGVFLSLIAARWIAAPVRRLALSVRALEGGAFHDRIRVAGPSEIRALARGFARMARAVADLIAREQLARHEAETANRTKDEFLATLSHELRTPLAAILGWAQLLRLGRFDRELIGRAAAAIERGAQAQSRLVEDLLDVSRIVAGKLQITRVPVSLVEPTEAAIEAVRPDAHRKNIALHLKVEGAIPPVLGDAQRLQQIVSNLLTNAVKFSSTGGRVVVRLGYTEGKVQLSVSDTGAGIAPEFLPYVFERFRQAESAPRESRAGLGIGLAIVQHLMTLHGGEVSAASDGPGAGSTFTITLPAMEGSIAAAPPPEARSPIDAVEVPRLDTVSVLLIDDDEDTLRVVRAMLEQAGANVETASSAVEARSALAVSRPAVIVSDILMPNEDGYAFMRSIRADHSTVPAIALTAAGRHGDADEARAAGFQIFMQKPVRCEKIVNAVASLAEGDCENFV
jgi:signal transduction histidine kinase/ActR/RegA family two-component response regulator